jgi:hypothetical protein
MARRQQLPDFLRPLFWDVEFGRLSLDRDRDSIFLRIMEHGDLPAVRWLLATYGKPMLREWLVGREGAGVEPPCIALLGSDFRPAPSPSVPLDLLAPS